MAKKVSTPPITELQQLLDDSANEQVESGISKAEAARRALEAGVGSPKRAIAFIKKEFGIDMTSGHFSATKSLLKKKGTMTVKTRGRPKGSTNAVKPTPALPANGEADLLHALEAMKPLVASLGADRVKRLADLLA